MPPLSSIFVYHEPNIVFVDNCAAENYCTAQVIVTFLSFTCFSVFCNLCCSQSWIWCITWISESTRLYNSHSNRYITMVTRSVGLSTVQSNYRPRTYVRREVMFSQVCVCSGGGVPGLRFSGGGWWSQVSDFRGGVPVLRFSGGGGPRSQISGGEIWLDTCSEWEKIFLPRDPPPSKGKNFWHQIWLDTCSDWEIFFLSRDPPFPPPRNSKKLLWLRGGRYASCVHAGGLSCCLLFTILLHTEWPFMSGSFVLFNSK